MGQTTRFVPVRDRQRTLLRVVVEYACACGHKGVEPTGYYRILSVIKRF